MLKLAFLLLTVVLLIACGKSDQTLVTCNQTEFVNMTQINCSNGYTYTINHYNYTCTNKTEER